ncbi:redox-regulated ATPase YchF [Cardinium endosymbiont of Oedothorax gibbosus]|uniref:redox-regulated ATPase YchF n=1 Tax=Cardinium endosymbiont of Oedothorax gibbosus TaxID=931101 RepID=UPI00202420CE|nr:redox-regulated ATPase YchF [Cardinium endosymbiont of Oedothorax gibbosus]CAH2559636.1 Ribosome-binding ATPase YchF [Cardinium endosymbiont of Oedothorax gibbosus]
MALRCGLVGLPNVGKSMLFNSLSKGNVASANFPFCTIEPNVGVVAVPDPRMELLVTWVHSKNAIPAAIEFVDIAGLVKDAHQGEGLGNKFLSHIREVDAIVHVIRCFEDEDVVHVAGSVDPVFDKQVIDHELRCKDIDTLTKRLDKMEKLAKHGAKAQQRTYELLNLFLTELKQGRDARTIQVEATDQPLIDGWQLLTLKPVIYFANADEATIVGNINPHLAALKQAIAEDNGKVIIGSTALEMQLNALNSDDKAFFLKEYNLMESALDKLIQSAYSLLRLITYFTVGPQEVRAWTIQKGTKAPQAAGVIHTDFQRGFIKAEVITFDDYKTYKSENGCREAGKLRIEGKDYIVQDGDVMLFRFNV